MQNEEIVTRIDSAYPDAQIEIEGKDCNFEVTVISSSFEKVRLVKRQQAVLALFKDEINSGVLHALSVKARTPDEWNALQNRKNNLNHLVQITPSIVDNK